MSQEPAASISPFAQRPALSALTQAFGTTQALLTGQEGRRRWRALALLAGMAGLVGAGAAPPPLGLLQPAWTDSAFRETLSTPAVGGGLCLTALLLLGMAAVARAFTFAFLETVLGAEPRVSRFRAHLRRGAAHFLWSSALSIPLYGLLFAGEWQVTHATYDRLLTAPNLTDDVVTGIFLAAFGKFLLVLAPWTLLTLPAMALMYELTPAAMLRYGGGPLHGCGRVLAAARKEPGRFGRYVALRVLLQVLGNAAALVALVPCALGAALVCAPLLAGGWALTNALGGLATGAGAAAATVSVLLSAVVLYGLLCAALLPVSVLLNAFALHFMGVDTAPCRSEPE
jgi:hypothetical protein